jgi:Zn-dependent protease
MAHSLVGRKNGITVEGITLFIFGGLAHMTREPSRPGAELKMGTAGPICSFVLSALFGLVLVFVRGNGPVTDVLAWLILMNAALAVFNLIPGFPLDGGRIFRSIL